MASASGAITDLVKNLTELTKNADIDFIAGDWTSEYNMTIRVSDVAKSKCLNITVAWVEGDELYEGFKKCKEKGKNIG